MSNLKEIFAEEYNKKLTENGDFAYKSTTNRLLDLLFMSEYFGKHLNEVVIGNSEKEQIFAMFMRDPRFGIGRRDLGRVLMSKAGCTPKQMVTAGRFDDVWQTSLSKEVLDYLRSEIEKGNELAKKWMPRYSSRNLLTARLIAKAWGMNKQQYGKFIKCNTTENKLSRHNEHEIIFEQVPSLAMVKYFAAFGKKETTSARFNAYLESVKKGEKKLNISTTNVYDIYKNRGKIDADLFFDKLEKTKGSWIPIVDSSGSMQDANDSYGKAMSIGHYLAKCSTYMPNHVISFSSRPQLIELGVGSNSSHSRYWAPDSVGNSTYDKEIRSMYTGDCSNTDFGKVMELLRKLDKDNAPEYLVVLSDMEFDGGSSTSKEKTMQLFANNGFKTKIIWWNFNTRNTTCPETDKYGNIFLSGYNPMLLKYLESGFDGEQFLDKLLQEYKRAIAY